MFKLVHISDLHYAPLPPVSWMQLCNKRLIGYINWQKHRKNSMATGCYEALIRHMRRQEFQHLAISGDLVNLALPQEFLRARERIAALGAAENVSLTFGNHDAYVPGALKQACAVFAPWIKGDAAVQGGGTHAFPYMRVRGEMAFIGVSSAIATPPFCAAGYFSARQAKNLAAMLRQARAAGLFRVVMIHHPPLYHATYWQKKLWGIKRFQNAVASEGAELVLHGHTHLPTLSFIPSRADEANPEGKAAVVGVPAAGQSFGDRKPPAGYNLLSFEKKAGIWHCELKRFAVTNAQNYIRCVEQRVLLG